MIPVAILAALALHPCPDDGRLKGVKIGSDLFKRTVEALPDHRCVVTGPNGRFLVTPAGVEKL
jgi:hypothetical protein